MPEEIDLNDEEEAALDRAWEKVGPNLPPASKPLPDDTDEG